MSSPSVSQKPLVDLRRLDPQRTAAWRWQAAENHYSRGTRPGAWEDPAIAEAVEYLRTEGGQRRNCPHLAAAHAIHEAGGEVRDELEARLLAGESSDVIAEKMQLSSPGLLSQTVETYETCFWNVRDRLRSKAWLRDQVGVRPGMQAELMARDVWCFWAIEAGPVLLDLLIAGHYGRPAPTVPDRERFVDRLYFLATEYAADWTSRKTANTLLREWERLRPTSESPGAATNEVSLGILRLAYADQPQPATPKRTSILGELKKELRGKVDLPKGRARGRGRSEAVRCAR